MNDKYGMMFKEWLLETESMPKAKSPVEKLLIVMRGLPGSGKSNLAKRLLTKHGGNADGHIISTDSYFSPNAKRMKRKGEFVSDADELKEYLANTKEYSKSLMKKAHAATMTEFKAAVDQGVSPLILDNTNVQPSNARAYAEYADKAGYEIKVQEPDSPWWKESRHLFADKRENKDQLDQFVKELETRQQHGVPYKNMRQFADFWKHNMTVEDILGREPTPKSKFEGRAVCADTLNGPMSYVTRDD